VFDHVGSFCGFLVGLGKASVWLAALLASRLPAGKRFFLHPVIGSVSRAAIPLWDLFPSRTKNLRESSKQASRVFSLQPIWGLKIAKGVLFFMQFAPAQELP
jgi:hypothetical protein